MVLSSELKQFLVHRKISYARLELGRGGEVKKKEGGRVALELNGSPFEYKLVLKIIIPQRN